MPDNAADNTIQMLVQYMDSELNDTEKSAVENMLNNDVLLNERYQQLLDARQAIKSYGLKQRVKTLHQEYINELQAQLIQSAPVKKISSYKIILRIAAVFFIAITGYSLFQYTSTTSNSVYNNNYIEYSLPVTRGFKNFDVTDSLYNAGSYTSVIKTFDTTSVKKQKDYFIAAQAYLQLNNADAAIDAFKQTEAINQAGNNKSFSQETDYYLALAYIKAGKIDEAIQQLSKIKNNPQHMYYTTAKEISNIKLSVLKWKSNK